VTKYLSIRNVLTVAGSATPVGPVPLFVYVRSYAPPVTSKLVQQLSFPLPPGPQFVMPGPPGWQLGGPFVGAEEPLAEVDKPEAEALEPEALELGTLEPEALELGTLEPEALELGTLALAPFAPEALVAKELLVVAASAPEPLEAEPVEPDAGTFWLVPPSDSDADLAASGSILPPQPSWREMTNVAARIRVWNPAALILLPRTIAVSGRQSQERARGSARSERGC
jgi:hypothetical protein